MRISFLGTGFGLGALGVVLVSMVASAQSAPSSNAQHRVDVASSTLSESPSGAHDGLAPRCGTRRSHPDETHGRG